MEKKKAGQRRSASTELACFVFGQSFCRNMMLEVESIAMVQDLPVVSTLITGNSHNHRNVAYCEMEMHRVGRATIGVDVCSSENDKANESESENETGWGVGHRNLKAER